MSDKKNVKTKWRPTDKRFVGFLDILGFKDLVARNTHSDIYKKLNEISSTKSFLENIDSDTKSEYKIDDAEIYIVTFSDSIVVFSKNDNVANFQYFLVSIRWLVAKTLENGTPLKGGIAHGEISLNQKEQIYFGQPIIDAYNVEGDVNYLGVVCHDSIDMYITSNKASIIELMKEEYLASLIREFKTPLKSGKTVHYNVNWLRVLKYSNNNNSDELEDKELLKKASDIVTKFRLTSSGSPRNYIDNSLEILENFIN